MSLRETLERLLERLYAGFNVYAALSFQVWVVALSLDLLVSSLPLGEGLNTLLEYAYWPVVIMTALIYTVRQWRRYIARLAAEGGVRTLPVWVKILAWLAAFAASGFLACMIAPVAHLTPTALPPFTLLVAITMGVSLMALFEAMSMRRPGIATVPAAMLAALTAAYPPLAATLPDPWLYTIASILVAYSTATLLYLHATLRRIA